MFMWDSILIRIFAANGGFVLSGLRRTFKAVWELEAAEFLRQD
jgi:hypothetical protein